MCLITSVLLFVSYMRCFLNKYFRTGMCKEGAQGARCVRLHDPARVAVCPQWLQGTCTRGERCPMQHKVGKGVLQGRRL